MDFNFPPDTLMLRDMLRRFVQKEARPLEMKYFTAGELAPDEHARLREAIEQLGLWGLMAPEEFGGGLDMVTACMIEEELGKTFVPVELGDITPLLYACSNSQVKRFLEPALAGERRSIIAAREPGSLTPEAWITTASPDGEAYLINGSKSLAMSPNPDDFIILFANAAKGLTAFLIDADSPGLSISVNGETTLTLQDCCVSGDSILGEPGGALTLGAAEGQRAWIRTGARYLGIVERLIEVAVEHAKDWISLGVPLGARPAIRRLLAETRVEVESARWLVYHAAWLSDEGQPIRSPAAQVRLATGEMLQRAVNRVTMVYTGPGPDAQIELQRFVHSVVPPETLQLALEGARAAIAAQMLDLLEF